MAKDSLNLCRREGKGKTRFAQTVSLPFSSLQQKFKAPSRAGYGHTVAAQALALERIASHTTLCSGIEVLNFDSEVLEHELRGSELGLWGSELQSRSFELSARASTHSATGGGQPVWPYLPLMAP